MLKMPLAWTMLRGREKQAELRATEEVNRQDSGVVMYGGAERCPTPVKLTTYIYTDFLSIFFCQRTGILNLALGRREFI